MLKRLTTLLGFLHSHTVPQFHVTQLLNTGDQRSLHLHHQPGQGYTIHEEYRDPRESGILIDSETWEDATTLPEALELFRQAGASLTALQAARERQTREVLVDNHAQLHLVNENGEDIFLDLHHSPDAAHFIQVFQQVTQVIGRPLDLIGRSADHEVAWQALFNAVPWGGEARMKIHQLLNH